MKRLFRLIVLFVLAFMPAFTVFWESPFSDVRSTDSFYESVNDLYDSRMISDDGSWLFRPNEPMNRDFFVSIITMMGCKECLTPSDDDMVKYSHSPFVDVSKNNQYYYCIAHAHEKNIVQGYLPDVNGNISCQNGKNFKGQNPFCAENKITRIEAAAMLLRRANLWNDNLNSLDFTRSEIISDVNKYWYGYAQKAIQSGILKKRSNNSIGPDEAITRGEFAIMSAKVMEYTQCDFQHISKKYSHASMIQIVDNNKNLIPKTVFEEGESYFFIPKTEPGNWNYTWTATDRDGNVIKKNGNEFPWKDLKTGKWKIVVEVKDPIRNNTISSSYVDIVVTPKSPLNKPNNDDIDGDGVKNHNDRCVNVFGVAENAWCPKGVTPFTFWVILTANPIVTHIDNPIDFSVTINNPKRPFISSDYNYNWDFWDGGRSYDVIPKKTHSYISPGIYPVTVTVTDKKTGETAQSRVIVRITHDKDTDRDGFMDKDDQCPTVRGTNKWCPDVDPYDYWCVTRDVYGNTTDCIGDKKNHNNDIDGDGVKNSSDKCIRIPWVPQNFGCPDNGNIDNPDGDNDNDGVKNRYDRCIDVFGSVQNFGCPDNNTNDTDGDGVFDPNDACVRVPGDKNNQGCPIVWGSGDTDGDTVPDNRDTCPNVAWNPDWNGCPVPSVHRSITTNVCLLDKLNTVWLLTAAPECNTCPCDNSIDISATIRSCDVVFPTILSSDKKTFFSRGNFYLLP